MPHQDEIVLVDPDPAPGMFFPTSPHPHLGKGHVENGARDDDVQGRRFKYQPVGAVYHVLVEERVLPTGTKADIIRRWLPRDTDGCENLLTGWQEDSSMSHFARSF